MKSSTKFLGITNGHWIRMHMANTRGNLTSHTKILDRILNTIHSSKEDQESMTTTYNLYPNFVVDIPTKEQRKITKMSNLSTITSTATRMAPSLMTTGLKQLCLSSTVIITLSKKQFFSTTMRLCFKLKYLQLDEQHSTLYSLKPKTRVLSSIATVRPQLWILKTHNKV